MSAKSKLLATILRDSERMKRAQDMGFDTSKIYYTGGHGNVDELRDSPMFLAANRKHVEDYAAGHPDSPTVYPVFLKKQPVEKEGDDAIYNAVESVGLDPNEDQAFSYITPGYRPDEEYNKVIEALRGQGINQLNLQDYSGLDEITSRAVLSPPGNIRSVWAKFEDAASPSLTASAAGTAAGLGLLANPDQAQAADVGSIQAPSPRAEAALKYFVDPVRKLAKNPVGSLVAPTGVADALERSAYGDELSTEDYVKAILDLL